jgi:hypothetical protein
MKYLLFVLILISSCSQSNKFKMDDKVVAKERCMATTTPEFYQEMEEASKQKDEKTLERMMGEGHLMILNEGQSGTVVEPDMDRSKIKIIGGSEWWVANHLIKKKE